MAAAGPASPASRAAGRPASIEDVPDAVICQIMTLCGLESGPSLVLVCKRWHDAIFAIPELWRELALVPSNSMPENRQRWLDSKARLLQRVGQHVHRVQLSQQAGLLVAETLLPAIGPQLQHLSWNTPVALLPDALPHRFPQLQRLWLSSDTLPACVTAVLPQLPLTDLDITARQSPYMRLPELPDGLVGSILQLTALSRLRLTSTHAPLPPGLEQLTRLRRLRHLRLADGYSRAQGETLRVPPPAAFPELRSCELRAALNRVLQVGDCILQCCIINPAPLEEATLDVDLGAAPSLPALLAALVPPALQLSGLRMRLGFSMGQLTAAGASACTQLHGLSELSLLDCSHLEEMLPAMVQQAPGLTKLECVGGWLQALPPAVGGLQHLRVLQIRLCNIFAHPPELPCISGLVSLSFEGNELRALPPWLENATRLTELNLSSNPSLQADAGALLCLPALRLLDIRITDMDSAVVHHIRRAAPERLQVLWGDSEGGGSESDYGGGAYASDSSDSSDGCPRLDFGGCAHGARWY